MPRTRLIFGCGYLGLRAATLWRDAGDEVIAATRSPQRAQEFRDKHGFRALVVDVLDQASLAELPRADSLLYAVGFDRGAGGSIQEVYADGLENVLAACRSNLGSAIYVSTTGVYGDAAGAWVDEQTVASPRREGGRASLAAEGVLAAHPLGRRSAILRLAGLYGPDRVPHLDRLRRGDPIPAPAEGWLNLIHVDDAARIVVAADRWLAQQSPAGAPHVFCVSDGSPVLRRDYYCEAARLLGGPAPQFATPQSDSPAAVRAEVSRRVSNRKLQQFIAVDLHFGDYRAGLASILAE